MPFTTSPWDGAAVSSNLSASDYCSVCLVDNNASGATKVKAECHFPVRSQPGGPYNVNALRAVVGGRGAQASFSGAEQARARAQRLLAEYQGAQGRSAIMETFYRSAELAYRDGEAGRPGYVEGRMVPYNVWTEIRSVMEGGHFLERILPGALTKTLAERAHKMRVLFQHGLDSAIGKAPIATLEEVRDEEDGAYYRARLFPSVPPLILDGLRERQYGASIAMRLPIRFDSARNPQKSEHNPGGLEERSVTEASLREMSIVTFPAYEGTTASVRSLTDELVVARLAEDPHHLLELVRNELQAAPPHSEPDEEPAPEEPQPDEPEPVEASRDTQPKPKRDWLSDKEVAPSWRIP